MMKHQNPLAESGRADFKTRTVRREGIVAKNPFTEVIRCRRIPVVFTEIEDHFEHPFGAVQFRLVDQVWPMSSSIQ